MPYPPPETLLEALQQPEMAEAFSKHIASEFSSENLEFHQRVEAFRKRAADPSVSDATLRTEARDLYSTYVERKNAGIGAVGGAEANKQVNLSDVQFKSVDDIHKNIGTAGRQQMSTMFNVADKGIVDLMNRDSFPRFKSGQLFKDASRQINEALERDEQQMQVLKARAEQLKNPTMGDRIKAATVGPTLEEQRQQNQQEIDKLQTRITSRTTVVSELDAVQSMGRSRGVGMDGSDPVGPQPRVDPLPQVQGQQPSIPPPVPTVQPSVQSVQPPVPKPDELQPSGPQVTAPRGPQRPPPPRPQPQVGEVSKDVQVEVPKVKGEEVGPKVKGRDEDQIEPEDQSEDLEVENDEMEIEDVDEIEIGQGRGRGRDVQVREPETPMVRAGSVRAKLAGQIGQGPTTGPSQGRSVK